MSHPIWELWTPKQRERMGGMLTLLGREDLYDGFPIVQVAGTNGKGSVCHYLDNILRVAGYRVGLFTSPHLYHETERIKVNGEEVAQEWLTETLDVLYQAHPDLRLFDAYLYAAIRYFEQQQVDIAVFETGLGGGMDVTSALLPILSCTCTIGLDHTQILGDTLSEIAIHKAGIAKPGVPMVLYPVQQPEAKEAFLAECSRLNSHVIPLASEEIAITEKEGRVSFTLHHGPFRLRNVRVPLLGRHQAYNAATAALCVRLLGTRRFPVEKESIIQGIETTVYHGRLEILGQSPLILLDGAHNEEGARSLVDAVSALAGGRSITLLAAIMADKDAAGVAGVLAPLCRRVITTLAKEERGLDPGELAQHYRSCGVDASPIRDPQEAFDYALKSTPKEGILLIAGSLYLPQAIGLVDGALPKPMDPNPS